MSTIAAGNSEFQTLTAGQIWTITPSGTGQYKVYPDGGPNYLGAVPIVGVAVIGPFTQTGYVQVECLTGSLVAVVGAFAAPADPSGNYLGRLAWTVRPLTGVSLNSTARFTGIGRNVELWTWDGSRWMAPGVVVLAQSAVAVPMTGVSAAVLASITIPGGCMGPNGSLRITLFGSMTNNANTKTFIIRYGGAQTPYYTVGISAVPAIYTVAYINNRGGVGSQVGTGVNVTLAPGVISAMATSSENSDADQVVEIVGVLGVTADTLIVESYKVELIQ